MPALREGAILYSSCPFSYIALIQHVLVFVLQKLEKKVSPRAVTPVILRPDSGPGHDATGMERISFTAQTGLWCLPVGSLHRSGADICDVLASDAALSTYAGHGHSLVARKGRPKKADALRKVALESF